MSDKLAVRSEALRWAMSKDGGQRLEGLYSRAQVATLYHCAMDAEHELALLWEALGRSFACNATKENTEEPPCA